MLNHILLGIIQGLTEFLPVSSSGHLIIAQKILGVQGDGIAISVILHLGTICALVIFFFKEILKTLSNIRLITFIMITTIITGIIGLLGKSFFESLFSSPKLVALALLITGLVLISTRRYINSTKRDMLDVQDAVTLGIVQSIAIIPGISRSGITISSLLYRKVDKETCFKFSFLASIPAIIGAVVLEAKKIDFALQAGFANFSAGFLASLLSGLFALWVLKLVLDKSKLHYFGYYCIAVAVITLLFI
ncbi:MAG: undecaprenyl-diphosphate phosphatase [Candidatus Omnitrophica bacterium]|nr:undecaprenyl-diphosphate phosphatase [Candidatus Omnitrophota bacterium]